jgi:hypothetical protein
MYIETIKSIAREEAQERVHCFMEATREAVSLLPMHQHRVLDIVRMRFLYLLEKKEVHCSTRATTSAIIFTWKRHEAVSNFKIPSWIEQVFSSCSCVMLVLATSKKKVAATINVQYHSRKYWALFF